MSESVEVLVQNRGIVRQRITKLCNKISEDTDFSPQQRLIYIEKLNILKDNVHQLDNSILNEQIKEKIPAAQLSSSMDSNEVYEDKIVMAFLNLNPPSATPDIHPGAGGSNSSFAENPNFGPNKLKLPQVPLPEFGNKKGENFQKFIRSFESIVNKHALSDHQKFIYLCKQLSNGPKILVDSLDIDMQSYDAAKELLTKAFDSSLNSKYSIIKKLCELKLPNNSDPYPFIGEMRTAISGFKSNKITIDEVCQYFIWNGLNEQFQSHLTAITNKSKPTLAEIEEHIFEATDRYNKQLHKPKESHGFKTNYKPYSNRQENFDSNSTAVNINPNKSKICCILCLSDSKKADHYLKDCSAYATAKNKFDKLRSINACTKCSFRNHDTKSCHFIFKSNCKFCQGAHMSYLCMKSSATMNKSSRVSTHSAAVFDSSDNEHNDHEHTNSHNVILAENYGLTAAETIVLPTFVAKIKYNGGYLPVRIFKDGGSQRTFLCDSINEVVNAPIVDEHIPLTVQGFNSTRKLDTKSVSITVEIGDKNYDITAICVDRIRTKFNVNGIHTVVNEFAKKGYNIADSNYVDSDCNHVDNIDIIFGTDVDALLPLTYQTFGSENNLSSFIMSPLGVIFSGDVGKMKLNLKHLPSKSDEPLGSVAILRGTQCEKPLGSVAILKGKQCEKPLGSVAILQGKKCNNKCKDSDFSDTVANSLYKGNCNKNPSEEDYMCNLASVSFVDSELPRDRSVQNGDGIRGNIAVNAVNCHAGPDHGTAMTLVVMKV